MTRWPEREVSSPGELFTNGRNAAGRARGIAGDASGPHVGRVTGGAERANSRGLVAIRGQARADDPEHSGGPIRIGRAKRVRETGIEGVGVAGAELDGPVGEPEFQ